MREKHFVLDIEAVNTDKRRDDILQIAFLEVSFKNGYWQPGRTYNRFLRSEAQPESQFAKENMVDLFKLCNSLEPYLVADVRQEILTYFRECGARPPYIYLMGWNATMMDIPFIEEQGFLRPFYRETINGIDTPTGDYHYRVYEQSGSIGLAQCLLGIQERNELVSTAFDAYPEIIMPPGKQHDALFDCYQQIRIENGLIRIIRKKLMGNADRLYQLVEGLWSHWGQECKECSYGEGGHCLIDEQLKLQTTQLLKIMKGQYA